MSLSLPHALDWCEISIETYKHYKKYYNRTREGLDDRAVKADDFPFDMFMEVGDGDELFYSFVCAEIINKFFQLTAYLYYFAIKQNKKKYLEIKEQFKIYMTESMEYYEEACENNLINEGHYKETVEIVAKTYNDAMGWCDNLEGEGSGWWITRARGKKVHTLFAAI